MSPFRNTKHSNAGKQLILFKPLYLEKSYKEEYIGLRGYKYFFSFEVYLSEFFCILLSFVYKGKSQYYFFIYLDITIIKITSNAELSAGIQKHYNTGCQ